MEALSPPTARPASRGRLFALQVAFALALALALTWPMALHPIASVVGIAHATVLCHLWVLWWAKEHLADVYSPLLFFPNGGDVIELYGSDLLSPLLLRWIPAPVSLLYNGWVVLLLVTGGVGAARLAERAGATAAASFIALAVYEAAPFLQHELLNGTSELLAAGFLSWFAIALLDLLDQPTIGAGVRAALWGLAAAFCSVYNLFFLAVIASVILLHRLATTVDPLLTAPRVRGLLAAALVAGAGLGALGAAHLGHGAEHTLAAREMALEQEPPLPDSYADLADWLNPLPAEIPAYTPMAHGELFTYWTTATIHLGFVAVGLAAFGALRRRAPGAPTLAPWILLVLVGVLIAGGPTLRIGGHVVDVAGATISLPARTLNAMLPGFSITAPHCYRYASVVVLGVAVLAAQAVRGRLAAAAFSLLVASELLFVSPVPWPAELVTLPTSPVLVTLGDMPEGAVLTAPTEADDLYALGRAMFAQTVHQKPMQDGGIHARAGDVSTALFGDNPLIAALGARGVRELPGPVPSRRWLGDLYDKGFRYLLVDTAAADVLAWAQLSVGQSALRDDLWALWLLPAPKAPSADTPSTDPPSTDAVPSAASVPATQESR